MNSEDLIQIADQLIYEEMGKHLTYLQFQILMGVMDRRSYRAIAIAHDCTEGHVRDVAYKLWKQLTQAVDEPVSKANVVAILERLYWSLPNVKIGHKKSECDVENVRSSPIQSEISYLQLISEFKNIGLTQDQIHDVLDILIKSNLVSAQYLSCQTLANETK
jgi:hypothetical protein